MSALTESFVDVTHAGRTKTIGASRRPCPVCGSGQDRVIHTQRYALFDDSRLPRETQVSACGECGMVFAVSRATAQDYRDHYAQYSKYETSVRASGSGESTYDSKRLAELVEWVAPHVAIDAAIIDVGAGRGGLVHAFLQRGYRRVSGIDPAEGCVSAMRAAGMTAHVGEIEGDRWPTDPDRFDLIVLSHVMEHVFDASAALHDVAQRVAKNGLVYLEVPDASRYTLDGFPPFYFFDPEHVNHFDADSLEGLARRCGMGVRCKWTRTLDLGSGQFYPAVGLLLEAANSADARASTKVHIEARIERYVAASCAAMKDAIDDETLDALRNQRRPLILWGAGSHAQRLLAQTALGACEIECIIDADVGKQGRRLAGLSVVSPDDGLARAQAIEADIVIAVAIDPRTVIDHLHNALPEARVIPL